MKKVIILSGVSGSGKSTLARSFEPEGKFRDDAVYPTIVSADDFFMQDGEYKFDPKKLSEAHAACFREFIRHVQLGVEEVVVDNTNTTNEEIAPYYLGASAFGYDVEIITVSIIKNFYPAGDHVGNLRLCEQRNSHRVPLNVINNQHKRLIERKLPAYWKSSTVDAKF